jgi:membrane protein required for colicin V production
MDGYDLLMIVVLVGATVFGGMKGMAWQIASVASLGVSYLVSLKFSERLAPMMGDQAPWNRFLAMLVLYMGTSLAIWIGFRFVAKFIERVKLKEFDRQIGALVGFGKGVLLCVAITFFAVTLSAKLRQHVLDSRSGYYIAVLLDRAGPMMPDELHDVLNPYIERLDQELQPTREGGEESAMANRDPLPADDFTTIGRRIDTFREGLKELGTDADGVWDAVGVQPQRDTVRR